MGQWNNVDIGMAQVRPEDMTFTKTYYGLNHEDIWFDSQLFNSSGKYYLTSNVVEKLPDGSLESGDWLPGGLQSSPGGLVPDPRITHWSLGNAVSGNENVPPHPAPTVELTAGHKLKYTVHTMLSTEVIAFDQRTLSWASADGKIGLHGTIVSPATQWLLPWREPNGATDQLLYLVIQYHVSGMYYGEQVNGFVTLEQMWAHVQYSNTWAVMTRDGNLGWFANEYNDGSGESGFWLCGEYGERGVAFASSKNGQIVDTSEINITNEGNNRLLYELGGGQTLGGMQKWEFDVDPTASLTSLVGTGFFHRLGDPRKIVHHMALYIDVGNNASAPCRRLQSK